jgi:hypothetical protein
MSESTTTTATVNANVPAARDWLRQPGNRERADAALARLACWATVTPDEMGGLRLDYAWAVGVEGLPESEYLRDVQEWVSSPDGGGVQGYLAESDLWPLPPAEGAPAAAPQDPAATAPAPAAAPAPGAAVAAAAAQAAEAADAAEAEARAEAKATLKAAVSAFRKGERAYKARLLEAGRWTDLYVRQRMALRDKREAAIRQAELALSEHSSDRVDPNRLIACYHAYRLLAEEPGVKADVVPYGHYRDAWVQLCARRDEGKPTEHWVLLEGAEADCRAAFAQAVKDGLSKAACVDLAKGVVSAWTRRRAEAMEAEARAKRQQAEALDAARKQANAEVEAKRRAEEEAKRAAEQAAQAETKAQLTAAANAALEERRKAEREAAAAQAEAEQAARDNAKAEKALAEAQAAADKAAERERKAAERANRKPQAAQNVPTATAAPAGATPDLPQKAEPHVAPVRKQIAAAGAKDAAEVLAEAIAGHETPDDVLHELLRALHGGKYAKALSKPMLRVLHAALAQWDLEERKAKTPSPAQVAQQTTSPAPTTQAVEGKAEAVAAA